MITAQDVRFTYQGAKDPVLRGLDFEVEAGEIFGFLGPNGAGKSTTQKILIGLLNDPEVLFLDEPTAGLDPASARRIKGLIREQREHAKTVFLTTHDMAVAEDLCDRVAFIVDGEIVLIDTPRKLKLDYGEARVRLEHLTDEQIQSSDFPLEGLGHDAGFLEAIRDPNLQTIHTLEAALEDIFIQVTGRALR